MDAQFFAFTLLSLIAVSGGIILSLTKNVVHGALSLLTTLLAVAGIFIVLSAGFIALVQILIYGGAVTILLLFALMLSNANEQKEAIDNRQKPGVVAVDSCAQRAYVQPCFQSLRCSESLSLTLGRYRIIKNSSPVTQVHHQCNIGELDSFVCPNDDRLANPVDCCLLQESQ